MGHTIDTFVEALKEQFATPKADLEKNVRALISEWISKQDLVSKDELQRQKIALEQATERLNALQAQMQLMEEKLLGKK